MARTHELKCWPQYFEMVADGRKPFELRKNDRGFRAGDRLVLLEWSGGTGYTGREITATVTCVVDAQTFGLRDGYAVLGLRDAALKGGG